MKRFRYYSRLVAILPIRFYRYFISPLLGPQCRFQPTCSEYAMHAVEQHGVVKGGILIVKRLCRCHPWHEGGFDPVPPTRLYEHSSHIYDEENDAKRNP